MRPKKPIRVLIEQVRITREGNDAIIDHADANLEALAARDAEAKAQGVTLLPGVGFDVVPSDCLAAHLKRRLPDANDLKLYLSLGVKTLSVARREHVARHSEDHDRGPRSRHAPCPRRTRLRLASISTMPFAHWLKSRKRLGVIGMLATNEIFEPCGVFVFDPRLRSRLSFEAGNVHWRATRQFHMNVPAGLMLVLDYFRSDGRLRLFHAGIMRLSQRFR
jgi:hypothetical protein